MTTDEGYEFTTDWLTPHLPMWKRWMEMLPSRKRFLEIGSYEGRSAIWLASQLDDGGSVTCVDPWIGNGEHAAPGVPIDDKYNRFHSNIGKFFQKFDVVKKFIDVYRMTSFEFLTSCQNPESSFYNDPFDFIYIDGSHTAKDCLTDCILAWPLLRPGGLMCIDDYIWSDGSIANQSPKWGIDVFTSMWGGELDFVGAGVQVVVRKRVAR